MTIAATLCLSLLAPACAPASHTAARAEPSLTATAACGPLPCELLVALRIGLRAHGPR